MSRTCEEKGRGRWNNEKMEVSGHRQIGRLFLFEMERCYAKRHKEAQIIL